MQTVHAIAPISKGQEVTVSYIDYDFLPETSVAGCSSVSLASTGCVSYAPW